MLNIMVTIDNYVSFSGISNNLLKCACICKSITSLLCVGVTLASKYCIRRVCSNSYWVGQRRCESHLYHRLL